METTYTYSLSRDDIRLFLRPVSSHSRWQRLFDMRVSAIGLLGAALIYASALVPALLRYNESDSLYQSRLPMVTQNSALAVETDTEPENTNPIVAKSDFNFQKLGIIAPVTWDVNYNEKEIQTSLQNGLSHLKGSSRPGENGTIILTGHSSNFAWAKGDYKTVFAPLLKSNLEDEIVINYQGKDFTYKVSQVYEVEPTRIDLLSSRDDVSLRLITCTPLGSTRKRLIVEAVQVDPSINDNTAFTGQRIKADEIIAAR